MIPIVSLSTVFDYFQYPRVKPIVTPRFALSCSERLMSELGKIAKTHDLHIQVGIFLLFMPLSRAHLSPFSFSVCILQSVIFECLIQSHTVEGEKKVFHSLPRVLVWV